MDVVERRRRMRMNVSMNINMNINMTKSTTLNEDVSGMDRRTI